jgi:hypothetical protein
MISTPFYHPHPGPLPSRERELKKGRKAESRAYITLKKILIFAKTLINNLI